jgi:hypothetical protein
MTVPGTLLVVTVRHNSDRHYTGIPSDRHYGDKVRFPVTDTISEQSCHMM